MFVTGQDFEMSVTRTHRCDCIPRECDYTLRCVEHVTGVKVYGVEVSAVPSGIVAVDSEGMILLCSWT